MNEIKLKYKIFKSFVGVEVWKYFIFSILIGFLWFAIESSFLFMIQGFLFSIGLMTKDQVYLPEWYPTSLSATITIMLIFGFIRAITQMLKNHMATLTQQAFICNQRIDLLNLGLNNASTISTKEIVTIFGDLIFQSGNAIYSSSQLVTVTSTVIFFFFTGLKIATYEMLIGINILAVLLIPIKNLVNKVNESGRGILTEGEKLNNSLLTGLRNNFFLAVYRQIKPEIENGSKSLKKYRDHIKAYSRISSFAVSFPSFIGVFVLSIITILSVKFFHTKPVKLISFFYIFLRLAQAAGEAGSNLSNIKLNFPGMQKLYNFKKQFSKKIDDNRKTIIIKRDEVLEDIQITANKLGFKYNNKHLLFNDINFQLKIGDALVIKGESGTGKSTLLSLILGINLPSEGELFITKLNTADVIIDLQNILGYVGPEPYFVSGTIKDNLLYGLESTRDISNDELCSALDTMELKSFIENLPLKLEEPIFDIPQFSTGQKQRLSFARALIRKPKILVLDEATANLDSTTEARIIDRLKPTLQNCISIIVTHKPSFDYIATKEIILKKKI